MRDYKLKRILKNPRKHRNIPQKYIKDGTERGVNQNPLKIIWGKLSRDAAVIGKILGSVTNLAAKVKNFLGFRSVIDLKCQS